MSIQSFSSSISTALPPIEPIGLPKNKPEDCQDNIKKVTLTAQKILTANDLDLFRDELLKKYNEKVVHALFGKLEKIKKKSLTESDKERFEVWCNYLEMESSYREQIHGAPSSKARLLNHYLKYTQKEVYYRMSHASNLDPLTHDHILTCKQNIEKFLDYQDELTHSFDELICHRSLTKVSILPSDILLGLSPIPPLEEYKATIFEYYKKEILLREKIESATYEELQEQADSLKVEISGLKSYAVSKELLLQLALKSGRIEWLHSPFPKEVIHKQADLFEACRLAETWAEYQEKLTPIPGAGQRPSQVSGPVNQNLVYFLNHPDAAQSKSPVAVFKSAKEGASMEKFIYDAALIFGLDSAFVPTKLKKFKGKSGSVQVFQEGLSWNQFMSLGNEEIKPLTPDSSQKQTSAKEVKISTPTSTPVKKVNLQDEIISSISMEDFLKAGLACLIFGNRDLHVGNFFFVQKKDGNYKISMFDNELSFYHSNYILIDKRGDCHLPLRNALLIFPQADFLIQGDLKKRFQKFVRSFEQKFDELIRYMVSDAGKDTLKGLPNKELSHDQLKAFQVRVEKLINMVCSNQDYTYRDLVYKLFPLYEPFLALTELLFPDHPEMMVGYHPAQELCDEVIKLGYMTEEKKTEFINEIKKYKYK